MNNDFSISANIAEKIEFSINDLRRQRAKIDELVNINRNETNESAVEKNKREIERLVGKYRRDDENTKTEYQQYLINLNNIIKRLTDGKNNGLLSEAEETILTKAISQRNKLLELSKNNSDILFFGHHINEQHGIDTNNRTKSPKTIEEKIKHFNDICNRMEEDIVNIIDSLIYSDKYREVVSLITKLDQEFAMLRGLSEELKKDIGNFKDNNLGKDNFSMSITEMERKLTEFRKRLREIKRTQMEHYNLKVEDLNARIDKLKESINASGLNEEDRQKIATLKVINLATGSYLNPGNLKYLSNINYDELLNLTKIVSLLEKKVNINGLSELEAEITKIENFIQVISSDIKESMKQEEINAFSENIGVASYLVEMSSKKDIDNKYRARIKKIMDDLNTLRRELSKVKVSGRNNVNHYYEESKRELDLLEAEVVINSMYTLKTEISNLDDIKERIKEKHNERKIDDNQFNSLMNQAKKIEERIRRYDIRKDDTEKNDILERIKSIKQCIYDLEKMIDALNMPVIDKEIKKKIELEIERLQTEIKALRLSCEKFNEDEDKYMMATVQIDKLESQLNKVSKKYREKCPLLVKSIKPAKDIYKNHKKTVLIASGLVSLALVHATIGPILGPAIIHGNLMLMNKIPSLRVPLNASNMAIAKLIGAREVMLEGRSAWQLSNGTIINPTCGAVSLLKGVSIIGISNAAIVAPIMIMIKELISKIKKVDLKSRIYNKYKEENINSKKKEDKEFLERMKELLIEYKKSNLSLDDFAKKYKLSERDKSILGVYDSKKTGGRNSGR